MPALPTAGTPRRCSARPAARRSPATSSWPSRSRDGRRSRWPWSTSPARASRPAPARCCSRARSVACSARSRPTVPAGGQRLPAAPGLERGLRHRDPPPPRPAHRGLRAPQGRSPAGRCSCSPAPGRWAVHEAEGPVLGLMPDAEFTWSPGPAQAGRRAAAVHRRVVETPQRDISLGIDKLLGQGELLLRERLRAGRRTADRPARVPRRRPGPAAAAPSLKQ